MGRKEKTRSTFSKWLSRPETLVGLSAVLVSFCALFISIYEASLIRQSQRASVWPHVEIGASMTNEGVYLYLRNTGIGPARIESGSVTFNGEIQKNWLDVMRSVLGEQAEGMSFTQSLINGRVFPSNSEPETIFGLTIERSGVDDEAISRFSHAILDGTIDVTICYSSVYNEHWTSSLQDVLGRSRGVQATESLGEVNSCDMTQRSGI